MAIVNNTRVRRSKRQSRNPWFEKLMALIAVINLILVGFDLTYVPLRDFWLHGKVSVGNIKSAYINYEGIDIDLIPQNVSEFITQYDYVKGIIPNNTTTDYIAKVNTLERQLKTKDINDPSVTSILGDLRRSSAEILDNDPFAEAKKSGNLERIKNLMVEYLPNSKQSPQQAFWEFWTVDNLKTNSDKELAFFDKEIKPLFETNYYRHIGENGGYLNYFGFIDFPFGIIFGLELIARTWYISRTRTGVSWLDAIFWRWYDLFFLFPFWRWLRVIPTTIRLNRAEIISLNEIQKQISQGIVAGIAEDVTEVVVIRIINQLQFSIKQGDISKLLSGRGNHSSYIDLNNTNETVEIVKIFAHTIVHGVLPKIQPEAEELLLYSIEKTIQQSTAYQRFKIVPGGKSLVSNLSRQLVKQSYQAFSSVLQTILEDDETFNKLLDDLVNNINKSLVTEIKTKESIKQIEILLVDLLEEVKINYVERLSAEDVEQILEQTRMIRQIAQN